MFSRFFGKRTRDSASDRSLDTLPFVRIKEREDDRVLRFYQGSLPGIHRTADHTYVIHRRILRRYLAGHPAGQPTHQFICSYHLKATGAILNLFCVDLDCRTSSVVDPDWIALKIDLMIVQELLKAGDYKAQYPNPLGVSVLLQSHVACGFWVALMLKRLESLESMQED